jgi:hypothetical protein
MSGTGKAMLLKDRFQLPVTCATAAVVEDYVAAVDLLLSAWPGARCGWTIHSTQIPTSRGPASPDCKPWLVTAALRQAK